MCVFLHITACVSIRVCVCHVCMCMCACACVHAYVVACVHQDRFTDNLLPLLCSCCGSVGIVWEHNRNQLEVWLPDCLGRNLLCMPAAMPLFTGIQIGRANHTLPQALSWEGQRNCNPERLHTVLGLGPMYSECRVSKREQAVRAASVYRFEFLALG